MIKFFLSNRILKVTEVLGAVSTTQQPSSASQRRRASASQSSHAAAYKIAPAAPGCLGSGCRYRGKREMGLSAFRGEMGLCAFLASRLCWRIRNRHLARLTRLKPSNALPLPMSPCPSHRRRAPPQLSRPAGSPPHPAQQAQPFPSQLPESIRVHLALPLPTSSRMPDPASHRLPLLTACPALNPLHWPRLICPALCSPAPPHHVLHVLPYCPVRPTHKPPPRPVPSLTPRPALLRPLRSPPHPITPFPV